MGRPWAAWLVAAWLVGTSAIAADRPMTDGEIALGNLDAQVEGLERIGRASDMDIGSTARIVVLLETRGRFAGRIADYERAAALADALVGRFPQETRSLLVRARTSALMHRFAAARADLERSRQSDDVSAEVDRLLASIDQATGRFSEALTRRDRAARDASPSELGARASLYAERGDLDLALGDFAAARAAWRSSTDVSPFIPAWLAFEEGLLWMRRGEWERARLCLRDATRFLPGYVPAQGHLAEVEAELGDTDAAIERLRAIVARSDDPDYAHQLSRLLHATGQSEESELWRGRAAQRFDELTARYPEAFADHAAEFWLGIGADAGKALELARLNARERRTPRACELWLRAALADESGSDVCAAAAAGEEWEDRFPDLHGLATAARRRCG